MNIIKIVFPIRFLMPGILPALAGAIGGSLVTGLFSKSSAKDQMSFQQGMSDTAHQREVKDLKAAGLNPILSAKYGGASTPVGAGYQVPNIGDAVSSAFQIKKVKAETRQAEKNADIADIQTQVLKEYPVIAKASLMKDINPAWLAVMAAMDRKSENNSAKTYGAKEPTNFKGYNIAPKSKVKKTWGDISLEEMRQINKARKNQIYRRFD